MRGGVSGIVRRRWSEDEDREVLSALQPRQDVVQRLAVRLGRTPYAILRRYYRLVDRGGSGGLPPPTPDTPAVDREAAARPDGDGDLMSHRE